MSSVTVLHAVAIFSVFAVGLIAGQMLAIGIANYAARVLPETSWTLRFQSENNLFAKTMPPFLIAPDLPRFSQPVITEDFKTSANSFGVR